MFWRPRADFSSQRYLSLLIRVESYQQESSLRLCENRDAVDDERKTLPPRIVLWRTRVNAIQHSRLFHWQSCFRLRGEPCTCTKG